MMALEIYGYKCKQCNHLHYPHRSLCRNCKNDILDDFELVPLPKTGKLLTYTNLHTPSADFDVAVLKLGIVELDNGSRITGQLEIDNPKIGMLVKGTVKTVRTVGYEDYKGMIFKEA